MYWIVLASFHLISTERCFLKSNMIGLISKIIYAEVAIQVCFEKVILNISNGNFPQKYPC